MPFHKITAHRIACLGLYKAFLSHIPHLPYSNTVKKLARSKVYRQFRKDRTIQGLSNIREILTSAYENEALFRRAATGDPPSISHLASKLKDLKALKKRQSAMSRAPSRPPPSFPPKTPPTTRLPRVKLLKAHTDPVARARRHKAIQILRRRLPTIVATSSLPLLRRPGRRQSERVAMILKNKIKTRQKRDNRANMLEDYMAIAKEEDMWDARLWNLGLEAGGEPWEERYEPEMARAYKYVKTSMRNMEKRSLELTERFKEIIGRERLVKEGRIAEYKRTKRRRLRQLARARKKVEVVEGEAVKGEAVKWKAAKVKAVKAEAAKVEAVKVKAVKAEAVQWKAVKAEAVKGEAAKVEAVQWKAAKGEAAKGEAVEEEAVKWKPAGRRR